MNQAMHLLTSQATTEWYTPEWLISRARATMGGIDLDPASNDVAQAWIQATRYYTQADDGYMKPWAGRVWLNPPFDDTPRWVGRLAAAYHDGDVTQAVLLTNSAPGYAWWENLWRMCPVCMLRERVCFVRPDGTTNGPAKKGQTVAYFGPNVEMFHTVWNRYGRVIEPPGRQP